MPCPSVVLTDYAKCLRCRAGQPLPALVHSVPPVGASFLFGAEWAACAASQPRHAQNLTASLRLRPRPLCSFRRDFALEEQCGCTGCRFVMCVRSPERSSPSQIPLKVTTSQRSKLCREQAKRKVWGWAGSGFDGARGVGLSRPLSRPQEALDPFENRFALREVVPIKCDSTVH